MSSPQAKLDRFVCCASVCRPLTVGCALCVRVFAWSRQAKCGILHADGTKLNLELLDLTGGSAEEAEDAATAAAAEEAAGGRLALLELIV